MKVGVISSVELCIPLLQLLQANKIASLLFADVEDRADFTGVAYFCKAAGINVQESGGSDNAVYQWLDMYEPDVVFVLGYKHRIDVKQLPLKLNGRLFNIHFGSLPAYRGPNPVFWQIKNGEAEITATIHQVTAKFDAGPIVWTKAITREDYFTYAQVNRILSYACVEGVGIILQHIIQGKSINGYAQPVAGISYHQRPGIAEVSIDWSKMTAREIVLLINACSSWNKGAITYYNGQELKIMDAFEADAGIKEENNYNPGTIIECADSFKIACINGRILQITMLNLSGIFIPARNAQRFGFVELQQLD
ncbi:methionyl-tRNA formyltransferase [Mucilaginibacter jinjuensis]|uniref:Formyltransferase family protein n=1 Tax=Mucilaginibacter jinjuensis TaxID=1176721 RepID=A0ABY7T6U4_9SPHI|nr:formyltransferase family protein [Mucilaginibacter jinjuensis]WCT11938.1 formyltransferase family protein [Mucilaginibacter jinjuensis]